MLMVPVVGAMSAFFLAALTDVRSLLIPNRICLALAAIAVLRWALFPVTANPLMDLAWAGGFFVAGVVLWHINPRILGAGDIKLVSAGLLWFGASSGLNFLIYTGLCGGALALAIMVLMGVDRSVPRLNLPRFLPFLLPKQRKVPYGVAILAGAIIAMLEQLEMWRAVL